MNAELIMQIIVGMFVIAFGVACVWGTLEMIKPLEPSKKQ
jgi:hypothetical protein